MPVGRETQIGPIKFGPYYPENLPFGIGQGYEWARDNWETPAMRGVRHPWPLYRPGTTEATPFGDAWNGVGDMMGQGLVAAPTALWEGTKALGNVFGIGPAPAPEGDVGPGGEQEFVYRGEPAPALNPFETLLKGLGGQGKDFAGGRAPGSANYSRARAALEGAKPQTLSGPDYTSARSFMEQTAPDMTDLISEDDKMMFILNGLSKAGLGVANSDDLGEILFALGMGSLGGLGQHKAAMKDDQTRLRGEMREYNRGMAGFEGTAAEAAARTQEGNADRTQRYQTALADFESGVAANQNERDWKMFDLRQPKISGNHMITSRVGDKGDITYSTTPLGDPNLATRMSLMLAAGGPPVSVSEAILGGQQIMGADPETLAQMRQGLLTQYHALLADPQTQELIQNMSGSGMIDVKSPEITNQLMMQLDNLIQQNDPEAYMSILSALQTQQMYRGLAGSMPKW